MPQAIITESFFENRQLFAANWVELWAKSPNPFLSALLPVAETARVELADISFNANPPNLGEIALTVHFRKQRAALRINLDSATFFAENPSWEEVPQLAELFEELAHKIRSVAGAAPNSQACSMAFHVSPGAADFGTATRRLVQVELVGPGHFYGVTRHAPDSALTIDKSMKYPGGAYVRLQRTFEGHLPFPSVAIKLLEDEKEALSLLGIDEIP